MPDTFLMRTSLQLLLKEQFSHYSILLLTIEFFHVEPFFSQGHDWKFDFVKKNCSNDDCLKKIAFLQLPKSVTGDFLIKVSTVILFQE